MALSIDIIATTRGDAAEVLDAINRPSFAPDFGPDATTELIGVTAPIRVEGASGVHVEVHRTYRVTLADPVA